MTDCTFPRLSCPACLCCEQSDCLVCATCYCYEDGYYLEDSE